MKYSKELRERAVKASLNTEQKKEVLAQIFGVNSSTITRWVKEYEDSGKLAPDICGRKKNQRKVDLIKFKKYVEQNPEKTQAEMAKDWGVSRRNIWNCLKLINYRKRKNGYFPFRGNKKS